MANIISGIQGSIGPGRLTPNTGDSQPHWYTATITPYAAPIDKTFMSAAFSGMRIDRNASMSRTNASPMMTAITHGSRPAR